MGGREGLSEVRAQWNVLEVRSEGSQGCRSGAGKRAIQAGRRLQSWC